MSVADKVRAAAIPFEASLYIKREGKDGWICGFAVHPDEIPEDMLRMRMGARVMLVAVEINDDETPKPRAIRAEVIKTDNELPSERDDAVMHAGMLCRDSRFQTWIVQHSTRYAMTEESAAVFIIIRRRLRRVFVILFTGL